MELREYAAVLARRWRWVAACLLGCLLLAQVAALVTPKSWSAQTQVFVSSTSENTSPSFLQQRVKSYPDIADSAEVLDPVRDTLGLDMSPAALRAAVSAENPVDTSQINITVVAADPTLAADIADAVAQEFSSAVQRLETTGAGTSPVTLTVTNPASVPTSPSSPDVVLLLALGLVCGLGLGVAVAVLRDRWDTRIWTADDVRAAWGPSVPDVLMTGSRRQPEDRAAQVLARRIERRVQAGPVRVVLAAPTERAAPAVAELTADLTRVLSRRGLRVAGPGGSDTAADPSTTTAPGSAGGPPAVAPGKSTAPAAEGAAEAPSSQDPGTAEAAAPPRPDVEFATVAPDAALAVWRTEVAASDGVVVVCAPGEADRVDVFELGQLLDGVEATVVGIVFPRAAGGFTPRMPFRRRADPVADAQPAPPAAPAAPAAPPRPTITSRPAAGRRPAATDNGWARLTPDRPVTGPGAPAATGADDEARPTDDEARPPRPTLARVKSTAARGNRGSGSSRRASAANMRRTTTRVTVRIPPSDTW